METNKEKMDRLGVIHIHTTKEENGKLTDHYLNEKDNDTKIILDLVEEGLEKTNFLRSLIKATGYGCATEKPDGTYSIIDFKNNKEIFFTKKEATEIVENFNKSKS